MKEQWWRIAFGSADGARVVVAPGDHLGAAIGVAAVRLGKRGDVWPLAAAPAAPGAVPLGESVGKGVVVEREAPERVGSFRPPSGVIAALDAPARASLVSGLTEPGGHEAHVIEAVAEGSDARERFLEVAERLPVIDNIEVQIADHYDAGNATDVWLTPRL